MTTDHLTLTRDATGYRTTWYDNRGDRHHRRFGKRRTLARNKFARFQAEWKTCERVRNPWMEPPITVKQAYGLFDAFAQQHFRHPDGAPTGRALNIEYAMRPVLDLFADSSAAKFGPKSLQLVQERMITDGLCRNIVNERVRDIRHVWKWLVAGEHIEPSVLHGLQAVSPIRQGYRGVRDTEPVLPVPVEYVRSIIEHAPPTIRAMIEVQYLTAMRPGEVCSIRPVDIDMNDEIWMYRPARHKMSHRGGKRVVLIGPKGQEVIKPFLQREVTAFLFSPREARRQRFDVCPTHRHQPVTTPRTSRRVGLKYKPQVYGYCIRRLCAKHGIPHWSPNQLRHNMATQLRRDYGLDVAQVVLGHSSVDVTEIYAEPDLKKAKAIMKLIG